MAENLNRELEGIEQAQAAARAGKLQKIIDNIDKSEARLKNALDSIKSLKDVLPD